MKNILKEVFLCSLVAFALLFSVSTLFAQESAPAVQAEQLNNPRSFALGITTLKEHGFGGMLRARWNHFAIDGSVGSLPWLIMYTTEDGETTETEFDMSFHSDLSCVVFINSDQSRFQNGIRLGALYDSIGGKGIMGGWTGEITFTTFALCIGAGIQYYPDIVDKLNEHFPKTRDAELDSSYKWQLYLGINCTWYLF
ncbi:MAG: hypothetical protein V1874_14285 [Spirochaetota bacterium]